ncbi:hypothetical protein AOLI_G00290280, partial [Acnodon oligacanthus]
MPLYNMAVHNNPFPAIMKPEKLKWSRDKMNQSGNPTRGADSFHVLSRQPELSGPKTTDFRRTRT